MFREALEGFEMVDGSHSEVIDRLRTRVRSDSGILARNRRRIRVAAVASLLVIATGSAFLFTRYIPELGEYQDVLSMRSVREEVSSILNGPPAELAEKEDIAHADVVQGGIVADNIAAQERSASETAGRKKDDRQ